ASPFPPMAVPTGSARRWARRITRMPAPARKPPIPTPCSPATRCTWRSCSRSPATPAPRNEGSRCARHLPAQRAYYSGQRFQRLAAERQNFLHAPFAHLERPVRITDQRTTDGDQIEFLPVQALQQALDVGGLGDLVGLDHELQEFAIQADAAHGDGRFARQLAGPAGQVQLGTFELRLPETPRRAMEDIHP